MTIDLDGIRALTFDVGGTVFDWHRTIRTEIARIATERGVEVDAGAFAGQWRAGFFKRLHKMRTGELPVANADGHHRALLDELAEQYATLDLSPSDRDELTRMWHRLEVWPDFAPALARLEERYTVVILTVFSWAIAVDSSKHAGLVWDGIISCEMLDGYKPEPVAYEQAARLLGLAPDEVMMVAAHPVDLHAAAKTGMRTAYVDRPDEWAGGSPPWDAGTTDGIDVIARDYADLAAQLVG